MRHVLAHREPRLLLIGQTTSFFGDAVANIALTLLILDTTHHASALGWFAAARTIPLLVFILFGGVIVDRVPRRALLLISDLGRLFVLLVVIGLLIAHHLTYSELIVLAVIFGSADAVFMPAFTAIVPDITPEHLLTSFNAGRTAGITLASGLIGPVVGGFLTSVSSVLALTVDAATFVVSALCLLALSPVGKVERQKTAIVHDIAAGIRYVRSQAWLGGTLVSLTLLNAFVFSPVSIAALFMMRHTFHQSKSMTGILFALSSVTSLLATLFVGSLPVPRRRVRVMWTYWIVGALAGVILVVSHNPWELIVFPLIAFPLGNLGGVIWDSLMQQEVPRELLGRVSAVDWFVSLGLQPVGLAVAGALFDHVGVRTYYLVAIIVTVPLALPMLLSRRVNAVDAGR
jgi:MFS family permease